MTKPLQCWVIVKHQHLLNLNSSRLLKAVPHICCRNFFYSNAEILFVLLCTNRHFPCFKDIFCLVVWQPLKYPIAFKIQRRPGSGRCCEWKWLRLFYLFYSVCTIFTMPLFGFIHAILYYFISL